MEIQELNIHERIIERLGERCLINLFVILSLPGALFIFNLLILLLILVSFVNVFLSKVFAKPPAQIKEDSKLYALLFLCLGFLDFFGLFFSVSICFIFVIGNF